VKIGVLSSVLLLRIRVSSMAYRKWYHSLPEISIETSLLLIQYAQVCLNVQVPMIKEYVCIVSLFSVMVILTDSWC